MRGLYRIRQGLRNFSATMRPEDWQLVDERLDRQERDLFDLMEPADQRHSVDVLRTLLGEGEEDPHLLKAALLHDVGKSRSRIGVIPRTLAVLGSALFGQRRIMVPWPAGPGWWLHSTSSPITHGSAPACWPSTGRTNESGAWRSFTS